MPGEMDVAIVTGASGGLGAALAARLARLGIAVGLTARRAEPMERLVAEIRASGGRAACATADAADADALRAAIARLTDELGPVNLLVANAGIAERNPGEGFSADSFARTMAVNLVGPAVAVECVLPGMLTRGRGQIVGISSLAGYRAFQPGHAGYAASKAGLSTFLEGLRLELAPRGIVVTAVHPGYIHTPMTAGSTRRMPFVLDADRAATIIVRGITTGRPRVDFPRPAALAMALVRILPQSIHTALAGRMSGPPRS